MSAPRPARFVGLALSVALATATPTRSAWALGDDEITPESANSARFGVEQEGKQLVDRGAYEQAAELYWREGVRLKDPVLILDSAEALRDQAAAERSIDAARSAIDRAAPALDMLYFLRDGATSSAWQPIAPEYVDTVLTRAQTLVRDAEALIREIEAEQAAAERAAAAPVEDKKRRGPAKPGTGLIAGGSAALIIGLGGAGLGIAGLAIGAQAQAQVEDPLVYEPEHSEAEVRGQNANVLAGVGLALAGVGVGVGVALIAVGVKKRKRGGGGEAEAALVPVWFGDGGGVGLVGKF